MSDLRKRYTISAVFLEVYNVEVIASSPNEALAAAQSDWNKGKKLRWYECPRLDEPKFQVEDCEDEEGGSHEPF